MPTIGWLYVAVIVGILARTLVPFLVIVQQQPDTKFDKKFLLPAGIALLLSFLASPLLLGTVTGSETYIAAYVLGWGGTDLIREGLKVVGQSVPALRAVK